MDLGFIFSDPAAIPVCNTRKKMILFNHFYLQYCYVLSLTGSLGMGISCMSYISSLSWACIALEKKKKNHHLYLYQYLVQDAKCVQPMVEEGQKRVRIKCIPRAIK